MLSSRAVLSVAAHRRYQMNRYKVFEGKLDTLFPSEDQAPSPSRR